MQQTGRIRTGVVLCAVLALGACGGGDRGRSVEVTRVGFASGPIADGCQTSGRKQANRQLCGCIQFVADRSLSRSDQRTASAFFADPHAAQEMRQSDNPRHEAFWDRYIAFTEEAELLCKAYS